MTTDAAGRFRLTGIGRAHLAVLSLRGPTIVWRRRDVYHAFIPVNPTKEGKGTTCNVVLDPGRTVCGRIIGPDGKPLRGVTVMDLKLMGSQPQPLPGADFTATVLDPRSPRTLFFLHKEKQLGAALSVRGDEDKPLTVRLERCGSVSGRLLDAQGRPVPGVGVFGQSDNSHMSVSGRWWQLYLYGGTNKDGRFGVGGLIPGVRYSVSVGNRSYSLTLQAGEMKDLGDITLQTRP